MGDDFHSGDGLFDDIDYQELLQSRKRNRRDDDPLHGGDDPSDALDRAPAKRRKPDATSREADADRPHLALARRILTEKFGYDGFRHEQEAAINGILAGENTLVIFPTGAGKSLCYQV